MKISVSNITVPPSAKLPHDLFDGPARRPTTEELVISHRGCGFLPSRTENALDLAPVQNADALISVQSLEDLVHVIPQVNNGCFHPLLLYV
jgi:hypothetical protein